MNVRHIRILLALLIALSLVTGSVASAWAAAKIAAPVSSDGGSDASAMEDCQKAAMGQVAADCACCDTTSKCTDAAVCFKKCGSHVVGYLIALGRMAESLTRHDRRGDPPEPPDWSIAPPAPPPRF